MAETPVRLGAYRRRGLALWHLRYRNHSDQAGICSGCDVVREELDLYEQQERNRDRGDAHAFALVTEEVPRA